MEQWDNKQWALFAYFESDEKLIDSISELEVSSTETVEIGEKELWVLTDEEAKILAEHLFGSNNVYFHSFADNTITPVVITDT
jgi:hypothetical protein